MCTSYDFAKFKYMGQIRWQHINKCVLLMLMTAETGDAQKLERYSLYILLRNLNTLFLRLKHQPLLKTAMNQNVASLSSIIVIHISSAYIYINIYSYSYITFFHGLEVYHYFKEMIICIYAKIFLAFLSLITFYYYFLVISLLSEEKYCNKRKPLEIINVKNLKPFLSFKQIRGDKIAIILSLLLWILNNMNYYM